MVSLEVVAPPVPRSGEILTPEALAFVADLDARFHERRDELLVSRLARREEIARTGTLDFLAETAAIREDDWTVVPIPADLGDRRVEITGPTDPKMAINALNSGARVWLADLEDAPPRTGATSSAGRSRCTTPSDAGSHSPRRRARTTPSPTARPSR